MPNSLARAFGAARRADLACLKAADLLAPVLRGLLPGMSAIGISDDGCKWSKKGSIGRGWWR